MTDHQARRVYDWDEHFRIFEQLRDLDIYSLQLSGSRPMTKGVIQKYLTQEFTTAARTTGGVKPGDFYTFIAEALRRVVTHANTHATLSATRANTLANYVLELSQLFPEERWAGYARSEMHMRGEQLKEIKRALALVAPIYQDDGKTYQDSGMWETAMDAVDISLMQYEDILDRPLNFYSDQFPRVRALTLAQQQEKVAEITFTHARAQTILIDESLRLATTMKILPDQYRLPLSARIDALSRVGCDLVVSATYSLDEAADFRNTSHLSRNLQRPIFSRPAP